MDKLTSPGPNGRGFKRLSVLLFVVGCTASVSTVSAISDHGADLYRISAVVASALILVSNGVFTFIKHQRRWMAITQAVEILVISLIAAVASPADDYGGIVLLGVSVPLLAKHGVIKMRWKVFAFAGLALTIDGILSFMLYAPPPRVSIAVAAVGTGVYAIAYFAFYEEINDLLSSVMTLRQTVQARRRGLAELRRKLIRAQKTLTNSREQTEAAERHVRDLEEQIEELQSSSEPIDVHAYSLSGREIDVLRGLVTSRGRNKNIAEMIGVTEGTVKAHLYQICNKVGVDSRMELMEMFRGTWPPDDKALRR